MVSKRRNAQGRAVGYALGWKRLLCGLQDPRRWVYGLRSLFRFPHRAFVLGEQLVVASRSPDHCACAEVFSQLHTLRQAGFNRVSAAMCLEIGLSLSLMP